jgi:CubicO group peptidase (beta-lactamase class C family)
MRFWQAGLLAIAVSVPLYARQAPALANQRPPGAAPTARPGDPLPRARPEDVGMSSARLAVIGQVLNADIAAGRMPGAVLAIARKGKLVYFEAFGYRDKVAGLPMTTDTIFNIASMTKPLTTVAALTLLEQGRLSIADPLSKYFPQFANMRVALLNPTGETILDRVPAKRPITLQDLMRHTSGLT